MDLVWTLDDRHGRRSIVVASRMEYRLDCVVLPI